MSRRTRKKRTLWFAPVAIAFVVISVAVLPKYTRRTLDRLPLKIRDLQVQGIRTLSAIDVKGLTGFHEGDPLFGSFKSMVTESIASLKTNPRVKDVSILRDMTGQVIVQVSERKPAALVNLDRLYYIDADGYLLDAAKPAALEASNLVVITGPWALTPANKVPELRNSFTAALRVLAALVGAGVDQKQVSEIHSDPSMGWIFYLVGSDTRIVFGEDDFNLKAKRLVRVLPDIRAKALSVREIDLDYRDRVIVKLKSLT